MAKSKETNSKSVKINHPPASTIKTTTNMPFSEVPATVYNGQPVQPLTTPKLRQLSPSKNVKIIGKGL